jgi:hypothetical protein
VLALQPLFSSKRKAHHCVERSHSSEEAAQVESAAEEDFPTSTAGMYREMVQLQQRNADLFREEIAEYKVGVL